MTSHDVMPDFWRPSPPEEAQNDRHSILSAEMEVAMASALEDVRILDFSRLLPGPYCTMLLGDLGADVIKVEESKQGDYLRWRAPYVNGEGAPFMSLNRNKRSL